ncbi:hypothetical protein [Brevundimonas naejangsanensis]|uniref:hypothetical protein n=1 Tax=Brevundimonas naejangsanensis TaxID=588932 RepID=UPI003D0935E6
MDPLRKTVADLFVRDIITGEMLAELYRRLPDGPEAFDTVRSRLDKQAETSGFQKIPGFLAAYEERMAILADLISSPT